MSLLDDILSEHHNDLLENGNLRKAAKPWTGENQWHPQGYVVQIIRHWCACGAETQTLQGIFFRETTPSGSMRQKGLDLNNPHSLADLKGQAFKTEIFPVKSAVCPSCLTKGFFGESNV